jgi:hypothetical protein
MRAARPGKTPCMTPKCTRRAVYGYLYCGPCLRDGAGAGAPSGKLIRSGDGIFRCPPCNDGLHRRCEGGACGCLCHALPVRTARPAGPSPIQYPLCCDVVVAGPTQAVAQDKPRKKARRESVSV